jgi:hypothetical protein
MGNRSAGNEALGRKTRISWKTSCTFGAPQGMKTADIT